MHVIIVLWLWLIVSTLCTCSETGKSNVWFSSESVNVIWSLWLPSARFPAWWGPSSTACTWKIQKLKLNGLRNKMKFSHILKISSSYDIYHKTGQVVFGVQKHYTCLYSCAKLFLCFLWMWMTILIYEGKYISFQITCLSITKTITVSRCHA